MSIGDLFGDDLKALLGSTGNTDGEADARSGHEGAEQQISELDTGDSTEVETVAFISSSGADSGSRTSIEIAVQSILAELSGKEAADIDLDAKLGNFGAEGLGLWAVVAEVERQTGQEFRDTEVADWKTPRDIIEADRSDT